MTLLDNSRAYLREINSEEGHGMDAETIEREAMRMTDVLIDARNAYMSGSFDPAPRSTTFRTGADR
jgi:hypothetical protein